MAAASHAGARARRVRAGGPGTRRPVVDLRRGGAGPAAPRGGPVQGRVSGGRGAWTARDRLLRGRPGARRGPRRDDPERDRASSARPRAARRKADTQPPPGPPSDCGRCGHQLIGADRGSAAALAPPRPDCSNRPAVSAPGADHTPLDVGSCRADQREPQEPASPFLDAAHVCAFHALSLSSRSPEHCSRGRCLVEWLAGGHPPSCATVAASTPRPFLDRHRNHVIEGPSNPRGSPIVGQVAGETGR